MPAFSVIISDDHQVVRTGLRQILQSQPDLKVIADCGTGKETLAAVQQHPCNVLLLDLALPDMSGLDVLKHVKSHQHDIGVLILSGYPEKQFGINVLRAGARGFISKGRDDTELIRAVRVVARGGRYLGPELAEMLVNGMDSGAHQPPHSLLSEREFQIFCKLAEGQSVSEIANKLFLSVKTVSTYRSRILQKMCMKSNADITYYAIKSNLLQ